MRREDIAIGVEYCETGPLAYGKEPDTRPVKVRFLSTDPNMRLLVTRQRVPLVSGALTWSEVSRRLVHASQAIGFPDDVGRTMREATISGQESVEVVVRHEKGELPCERWVRGNDGTERWLTGLCKPASVHRTWAEHEEAMRKMVEWRAAQRRERAPGQLTSHIGSVVEITRFLGLDLEEVIERIREQYKKEQRR